MASTPCILIKPLKNASFKNNIYYNIIEQSMGQNSTVSYKFNYERDETEILAITKTS